MVQLAIRDDDLNFFTKVEDVEKVYEPLKGFPVSFAVIPAVTDVSTVGKCPETRGNKTPLYIGDNKELCEWLKYKLSTGSIDVCMHGINHTYTFDKHGKVAEMLWRHEDDLADTIAYWKNKMEGDLDYKINCFVAPSNLISKYCITCVAQNNMNFSGIVPFAFNRALTAKNVDNYIKRWWIRLKDRLPYPGVLTYSTHKEVNACTMQSYDYLVRMFNFCKKHDYPMVINVHYWMLRDRPNEHELLVRFVNYALENGAQPATISNILRHQ